MRQNRQREQPPARAAVATMQLELVALEAMTVGELAQKYLELVGTPTRSRNTGYLRKHLAWRIQERAEGGLSPRALDRIEQLAHEAPARWRRPVVKEGISDPETAAGARTAANKKLARDLRLPPVGATLRRHHGDIEHEVKVLESGFEYLGKHYRSLSAIARVITGQSWNGFTFFGRTQARLGAGAE